jgi:hypothetical protein
MDFIKNIKGITGESFDIGGITLYEDNNQLGVINSSGSSYTPILGGRIPSSSSYNNIPNLIDLYGLIPLIEFSFDGNTPPATGSYLNKFGICYTTGGDYTSNDVYFDNGNTFLKAYSLKHIVTSVEIKEGDVELEENTIYSNQSGVWTPKGSAGKGTPQIIHVPYSYQSSTFKSESRVPASSFVINVTNKIEEVFNGSGANLSIYISGSIINNLATTDNLLEENQYEHEDIIFNSSEGVVTVEVFPSGSVYGSGSVFVQYVIPRT